MAVYNSYFPSAQPKQIVWIPNFVTKLTARAAELGYQPADIVSVVLDCNWALYCIQKVGPAAKTYGQSMTAAIKNNLYSEPVLGSPVPLPGFALPTPVATQVLPGALTRVFRFNNAMKTRPQYLANPAIGEDLGVVGEEVPDDSDAVPRLAQNRRPRRRSDHPIHQRRPHGRLRGMQHRRRPLAPGKTAEKRRYRLCFWDGEPTNVWVTTEDVAFAG